MYKGKYHNNFEGLKAETKKNFRSERSGIHHMTLFKISLERVKLHLKIFLKAMMIESPLRYFVICLNSDKDR